MAKKPQVICLYCNKKFYREDEEYEQVGRRYAHKECVSLKDKIHKLMQKKCGQTYSKGKIDSQISKFTKDGYELKDIWGTINWWFEIKNQDASKANGGIGIFPHVFSDYMSEQIKKSKYKDILQGEQINKYIDAPRKPVTVSRKYVKKPKRVKLFELKQIRRYNIEQK